MNSRMKTIQTFRRFLLRLFALESPPAPVEARVAWDARPPLRQMELRFETGRPDRLRWVGPGRRLNAQQRP